MKATTRKAFPDISDILERKAKGRTIAGARSLLEKIAIVEALRSDVIPQARERPVTRRAAKNS